MQHQQPTASPIVCHMTLPHPHISQITSGCSNHAALLTLRRAGFWDDCSSFLTSWFCLHVKNKIRTTRYAGPRVNNISKLFFQGNVVLLDKDGPKFGYQGCPVGSNFRRHHFRKCPNCEFIFKTALPLQVLYFNKITETFDTSCISSGREHQLLPWNTGMASDKPDLINISRSLSSAMLGSRQYARIRAEISERSEWCHQLSKQTHMFPLTYGNELGSEHSVLLGHFRPGQPRLAEWGSEAVFLRINSQFVWKHSTHKRPRWFGQISLFSIVISPHTDPPPIFLFFLSPQPPINLFWLSTPPPIIKNNVFRPPPPHSYFWISPYSLLNDDIFFIYICPKTNQTNVS